MAKTKKTKQKKPAKTAAKKDIITKNTAIGDVVSKYPQTAEVFAKHGLHCIGCAIASFESVEQGARSHGVDAGKLLKDLNTAAKKKKSSGHQGCSCC